MKACPFRLVGVKGDVVAESANGGDATPVRSVQCVGELCALYREYVVGPNKVAHDCAFVAAGTDAMHLRDQISAIVQVMRASAPRR